MVGEAHPNFAKFTIQSTHHAGSTHDLQPPSMLKKSCQVRNYILLSVDPVIVSLGVVDRVDSVADVQELLNEFRNCMGK